MGAVAERIHYAEARRATYSVIAGVMVAGGLALLTLALGAIDSLAVKYAICAAAVCFTLVGILIFVVYGRQTNRYPWTSATKTWKWFYRDALPRESAFDIGWGSYFRFGKDKKRIQSEYASQLPEFKTGLARLSNAEISLEQDAEQLYVLHVNEKYKNLHLSYLRTATNKGLLWTIPIVLAAGILGIRQDYRGHAPHRVHYETNVLRLDAQWRILDAAPETHQSRILLIIHAINRSGTPLESPTWRVIDSRGWLIPSASIATSLSPNVVPARTSVSYSQILATGEAGRSDAENIVVSAP